MKLRQSVLLNKIEEADERCRKCETMGISNEKRKPTLMKDVEKEVKKTVNVVESGRIRPKSADGVNSVKSWKTALKERPNSCTFEKRMSEDGICAIRCERKRQDLNVQLKQREIDSVKPPFCMCGIHCYSCFNTHQNHFSLQRKDWLAHLNQMQRCKSAPNILGSSIKVSSQMIYSVNPLRKFKRSLKLLGFDSSDFGIYLKKTPDVTWRKTRSLPRLSTKLTRRTVSLDSLREAIRNTWTGDCLDLHQRQILSQAVYEEWYFRKEREWQIKQEKKKMEAFRNQEKICRDYVMKKVRAEEEFRKWALRKRKKKKENDEKSIIKTFEKPFDRGRKTKEEIEKAFLRWKNDKDKELREKGKNKKREEENNREAERQKKERKIIAEKAFQQWKKKLHEWKKCEKEKRQKKQERFEKRQKRERDSQISFQIWKATKDEAIRQNSVEMRNAAKVKNKESLARLQERLSKAEKAFEEWLERKSFGKQSNTETRRKNIPWIPV